MYLFMYVYIHTYIHSFGITPTHRYIYIYIYNLCVCVCCHQYYQFGTILSDFGYRTPSKVKRREILTQRYNYDFKN